MFRNHYGHRYHQNTFQRYYNVFWALQLWRKCRICFTLPLIMRERFRTSWNQSGVRGALGQSTKNSFPVVLRPHVFTRRSSTFETLKSKQRGLLNFYLHQVEGNREINLCRSFLILKLLLFTVPDNTQQHGGCLGSDVWLKKSSLLMIFSSLIFQAVQNVILGIPCWYTPYRAWKLRETFWKIANNSAPHRRETWIRCIFMSPL